MAARRPRTSDELHELAEHLLYECSMLKKTTDILGTGEFTGQVLPDPMHNALLESLTMHARALINFFYPPRRQYEDDAFAKDFYADWTSIRPPLAAPLRPVRDRVGKEIVHLTYHRIDIPAEAKNWNYGEIWTAVKDLLVKVANNAPPDGPLGDDFKRKASKELGIPRDNRPNIVERYGLFSAATQGISRPTAAARPRSPA